MSAACQMQAARVTGFASAVLLVLLLATSGWPADVQQVREEQKVACCDVQKASAAFCAAEPEDRALATAVGGETQVVRVAPRYARVDSWGLPAPRAPTNTRQ